MNQKMCQKFQTLYQELWIFNDNFTKKLTWYVKIDTFYVVLRNTLWVVLIFSMDVHSELRKIKRSNKIILCRIILLSIK